MGIPSNQPSVWCIFVSARGCNGEFESPPRPFACSLPGFLFSSALTVRPLRPHSHEAWRKLLGSYSRPGPLVTLVMIVGTKSDVRMLVSIMYGRWGCRLTTAVANGLEHSEGVVSKTEAQMLSIYSFHAIIRQRMPELCDQRDGPRCFPKQKVWTFSTKCGK